MSRRPTPPLPPHQLRAAGLVAVAAVAALLLTGCGGGNGEPPEPDGPDVTATIVEPADNATEVITATEVVVATDNAQETLVTLEELDGGAIDGELSEDGTRWLPTSQLAYDTTYVATLTAVGESGENTIATSTFTTMAEPDQTVRVFSFLGTGDEVGVGMPLRIEFKDDGDNLQAIPEEARADVEQRLTVRTDPPQDGGWHWVEGGAVLHYRPQEFWQAGTQISYRAATGGLPLGDDRYLRNDLNLSISVGRSILMEADATTSQLLVTIDGEVERSIPISVGRAEFPSSSGTFVIMEKFREIEFDTTSPEQLGDRGYVIDIEYAMRLTYKGEFIHAAVAGREDVLGQENVTHGCINMADDNAQWLFENTNRWGDPVVVTGTGRQAEPDNGWTDWNLSWEQVQAGSALTE